MEKYDIENSFLKNLKEQAKLEFDYEIRNTRLEDNENLNSKMYYYNSEIKKFRIINYNNYWDSLEVVPPIEIDKSKLYTASCIKRLVSKKKRRFQNELFDLDMAYITKRVIAIGFPATGCETIYRNSLTDILNFFFLYHNNNIKVYNLCLEKERIYDKSVFNGINVGLFPSKDHNPCPLKLILDCCIDIILFLINNPESLVAIHCKAGKGRTGVMICCYLIFSGLCKSAEEAMNHYSVKRTYDKKGVTIPSQKRYIRYFESFLKTNYSFPYIYMIPKIIKYHLKSEMTNILNNFVEDPSYFYQKNCFKINSFQIGPFPSTKDLNINICDFFFKKISLQIVKAGNHKNESNLFNYRIELTEKAELRTDIKISVRGSLRFDLWLNLWYSTLELIKVFIDESFKDLKHHQLFPSNFCNPEIQNNLEFKDTKLIQNNEHSNIDEYNSSNQRFLKMDQSSVTNRKSNLEDNKIEFTNDYIINDVVNEEADCIYIESMTNLFEIIEKVNHNETDLNLLIENINKICVIEGKTQFNKKDMTVSIPADQLDNFSEGDNKDGLAFKVNFSLLELKK